jgi:dihydrofolate reductase
MIIIVARNKKHVIGAEGDIPWKNPTDMQRFKMLTSGNVVIMGRKTYESIGRPLPNRVNIVISRQNLEYPKCLMAKSLDEALDLAMPLEKQIYVIGGAEIYRQALPLASTVLLTEIDDNSDGDTFFEYDEDQWKCINFEMQDNCIFKTLVKNYQDTSS